MAWHIQKCSMVLGNDFASWVCRMATPVSLNVERNGPDYIICNYIIILSFFSHCIYKYLTVAILKQYVTKEAFEHNLTYSCKHILSRHSKWVGEGRGRAKKGTMTWSTSVASCQGSEYTASASHLPGASMQREKLWSSYSVELTIFINDLPQHTSFSLSDWSIYRGK